MIDPRAVVDSSARLAADVTVGPFSVIGAEVEIRADGFPGRSFRGRVEEIPGNVTLRRIKPQDPARPTDVRVLAVKVAFAEKTPLKLGTTVDLVVASPR